MSDSRISKAIQNTISVSRDSLPPDGTAGKSGPSAEDSSSLSALLAPPQTPEELGRLAQYRILKVLGEGGMGLVLLAEDVNLRRKAAVKIVLPQFASHSHYRERFLREARTVASIKHDHVVTIYQVGEERGLPFMAMEFLHGVSLDAWLKQQHQPLSMPQIVRIGREIAEGLRAAHAQGLIHRDIKPANLWLEAPAGRVKVLDFGLAREENTDLHLTNTGAIVGTPLYMSPEQAMGETLDMRSDLFSLGVVLYQLCTLRTPFSGKSTGAVIASLAFDQPTPVCQINPAISKDLERLIDRLLAKKPADRLQSAQEVIESLCLIQQQLGQHDRSADTIEVTAVSAEAVSIASKGSTIDYRRGETSPDMGPIVRPRAKPRRGIWGMTGATAVVLLAVVIFLATRTKDAPPSQAQGKTVPVNPDNTDNSDPQTIDPPRNDDPKGDEPKKDKKIMDDPPAPAVKKDVNKPLATANHPKGLIVEVMKIVYEENRDKVKITWRYRNPTVRAIRIVNGEYASYPEKNPNFYEFWIQASFTSIPPTGGTKEHPVAFHEGINPKHDASELRGDGIEVLPMESIEVYARFKAPSPNNKTIDLQLPDLKPIKDLPYSQEKNAGPAKMIPTPVDGQPLATAMHPKGLIVEVMSYTFEENRNRVKIVWRYRNPTNRPIRIVNGEVGTYPEKNPSSFQFWDLTALLSITPTGKTARHPVARMEGISPPPDATSIRNDGIEVPAMGTFEMLARFAPPTPNNKTIELLLLGLKPIEDLPISLEKK